MTENFRISSRSDLVNKVIALAFDVMVSAHGYPSKAASNVAPMISAHHSATRTPYILWDLVWGMLHWVSVFSHPPKIYNSSLMVSLNQDNEQGKTVGVIKEFDPLGQNSGSQSECFAANRSTPSARASNTKTMQGIELANQLCDGVKRALGV